jgi:hypothetical protein
MKAPSGGYVIRMQTENATLVQKVMLMKWTFFTTHLNNASFIS